MVKKLIAMLLVLCGLLLSWGAAGAEDCAHPSWTANAEGTAATCSTCAISAGAKSVYGGTTVYYATLLEAMSAEPGSKIYALADYVGDFRIQNMHVFYGGDYVFSGNVTNQISGYIYSGSFEKPLTNYGSIYGGFFGDVTNESNGDIYGGTFGDVTNMSGGTIKGGSFSGTLKNNAGGTIRNVADSYTMSCGSTDFMFVNNGSLTCEEHFCYGTVTCQSACSLCEEKIDTNAHAWVDGACTVANCGKVCEHNWTANAEGTAANCGTCGIPAGAKIVDGGVASYYVTLQDAMDAVTKYGVTMYALADYDQPFTIINDVTDFYGGDHTFSGDVKNEGDKIWSGHFTGMVENDGRIYDGVFDGEVNNTNYIYGGTFNGHVINNGYIENVSDGYTIFLGENFTIENSSIGVITCADGQHIFTGELNCQTVCRLTNSKVRETAHKWDPAGKCTVANCGKVCEHTSGFDGITHKCPDCGMLETFSITVNGNGVKIVGNPVARYGQGLMVELENTASDLCDGVYVSYRTIGGDYVPVLIYSNELSLWGSDITGDIVIGAYAEVNVTIDPNGGTVKSEYAPLFTANDDGTYTLKREHSHTDCGHTFVDYFTYNAGYVCTGLTTANDVTYSGCVTLYNDLALKCVWEECTEHTYANGYCSKCGTPKTYTVRANQGYGVGIVGSPVATHGQDLVVELDNIGSAKNESLSLTRVDVGETALSIGSYSLTGNTLTIPAEYITGDVLIYAVAYVDVTFDLAGGKIERSVENYFTANADGKYTMFGPATMYRSGESIRVKDAFIRTGYRLYKIVDADDKVYEYIKGLTGDLELTCVWEPNSYTVTWNANGGTFAGGAETMTTTQIYDAALVMPGDPVRIGYVFTGWSTAAQNGTPVTAETIFKNTNDDTVYYAVWAVCDHADADYAPTADGEAHAVNCAACGYTADGATHDFDSATGKCGDCKYDMAVAKVTIGGNTTYYTTLNAAFDAARDTAVITVLADTEITQTICEAADVELKLNSKTITVAVETGTGFSIGSYELTVDGPGSICLEGYGECFTVGVNGELTINGGTFTGSQFSVLIHGESFNMDKPAKVNINGGTFTAGGIVNAGRDCIVNISGNPSLDGTDYEFAMYSDRDTNRVGKLVITSSNPAGWRMYASAPSVLIRNGIEFVLPEGFALQVNDNIVSRLGHGQTGTIVAHEHDYKYTSDGEETHSGICACGKKTGSVEHDFALVTAGETHTVVCTECDYEKTGFTHDYTAFYHDNGDGTHTGVCQCGAENPVAEGHTIENGTCADCPYMQSFAVNIEASENGTVTADVNAATTGYLVSLSIVPDENYMLDTITVVDAAGTEIISGNISFFEMPPSNVTVKATFKQRMVTLTLDTNGGTTEIAPQLLDNGKQVSLEVFLAERAGHSFTGWNAQPDGSGQAYAADEVLTVTEDMTLYAQWSVNSYTITFVDTGDTVIESITQEYDTEVIPPADPVWEGFLFAGWECDIPLTMPSNDMTISALWYELYTITINTEGDGVVTSDVPSAVAGDAIELTVTPGVGQLLDSLTVTDATGNEIEVDESCCFTMPAGNVTVHAVFAKAEYYATIFNFPGPEVAYITFPLTGPDNEGRYTGTGVLTVDTPDGRYAAALTDADGVLMNDTMEVAQPSCHEAGPSKVQAKVVYDPNEMSDYPLRFIYDLLSGGLIISSDENGTVTADKMVADIGDTVTLTIVPQEGYELSTLVVNDEDITEKVTDGTYTFEMPLVFWDVPVDAAFELRNTYTVTFDANGGEGTMEPQIFTDGIAQSLTKNVFTREGCIFLGWNANASASEAAIADEESITVYENMTLYAVWMNDAPAEYTVTVTNDGKGTAFSDIPSGSTGTVVSLETIANPGYRFKEWQVISGNVTVVDGRLTIGTENIEVKAIFEENSVAAYTLTVNNGTGSGAYAEGDTVSITAAEPEAGRRFAGWRGLDGLVITSGSHETEEVNFIMPARDVTVTATYEPIPVQNKKSFVEDYTGRGILAENLEQTALRQQIANSNGSLAVRLTIRNGYNAETRERDKALIDALAKSDGNRVMHEMDIDLTLEQYDAQNNKTISQDLGSTNEQLINIMIPVETADQDAADFAVYRVHNGAAQSLPVQDEKFEVDIAKGIIMMQVKQFSSYAIACSEDKNAAVIVSPTEAQTITVNEGETATMSISAQNAVGYQWYVNYNDGMGWHKRGTNADSYTTSSTNPENDGYRYKCVVTGEDGQTVESHVFTLEVLKEIDVPQTGDDFNLTVWGVLMLLSVGGLIMIGRKRGTAR